MSSLPEIRDHLVAELRLPTSVPLAEAVEIAREFVQRAKRIEAHLAGVPVDSEEKETPK